MALLDLHIPRIGALRPPRVRTAWLKILTARRRRPTLQKLSARQLQDIGLIKSDLDVDVSATAASARLELIARSRAGNW